MFLITLLALGLVAMLYASVGHGGASGYLAVLAFAGYPAESIRATVLVLNIIVSGIALIRFSSRWGLKRDLLTPLTLTAVPCAFIAGRFWSLDETAYRMAIAAILVFAAWSLATSRTPAAERALVRPPWALLLAVGGVVGLVSGLVGIGGGIFLSPILIFSRWANERQTSGVSAAFVLLASLAGLLGLYFQHGNFDIRPIELAAFAATVATCGFIGAGFGAHRSKPLALRRLLSVVLLIAAAKLVLT